MKNKVWIIVSIVEAVIIIAAAIVSVYYIGYLQTELKKAEKYSEMSYEEDTKGRSVSLIKDGDTITGVKLIWPEHIYHSKTADVTFEDEEHNEAYHFHYNLFLGYVIEEVNFNKYSSASEFKGWKDKNEDRICEVDTEGNELILFLPPDMYENYTIYVEFLDEEILVQQENL